MPTNKNLRNFLAATLFTFCATSHAQEIESTEEIEKIVDTTSHDNFWEIQTVIVRTPQGGENARLSLAILKPPKEVAIKHIILIPSTSIRPELPTASGQFSFNISVPWIRAGKLLGEQGILLAYADVPSDANGRPIALRARELFGDLKQSIQYLAGEYPHVPINIGAFSNAAIPTLNLLKKLDGIDKAIIVSGAFLDARDMYWRGLKTPVMLIHAPTAQCDHSPFLEAEIVARQNGFSLVKAGYERKEPQASCAQRAQSRLIGLDREFATLVSKWLNKEEIPNVIGSPNPETAWREQVLSYTLGTKRLEMTLLLPDGPGPYPLLVFNHGDIVLGMPFFQYKRRYRQLPAAREFLRLGIAVAFPSRQGVGMSEGIYPFPQNITDADPSYIARQHALSIMSAIEYLKTRDEIDQTKVILAGQSAGGFAVMYIASQNPRGIIGAIEFAGARPDNRDGSPANFSNPIMIDGHSEFGKTTRFPTLMIYAENDSRTSSNTIRLSYEAYVNSGGKATLFLNPPLKTDGHFIVSYPDLWRPALLKYLKDIGITRGGDDSQHALNR